MSKENIEMTYGAETNSNRTPNRTAWTSFAVICLVIAGLLAIWVILQEDAVNTVSQPAPHPQVSLPLDAHQPAAASEQYAPPLNAITLPSMEQQQAEIEAVRKAEMAAAMERARIEKEAALKKQRERERRQRKAEQKQLLESSEPAAEEDKSKEISTPQTQTPATCPEPDQIASAPGDERYNTMIGNKIPGSNNPEGGACSVQLAPR